MKTIVTAIGLATLQFLQPQAANAQMSETTEETEVTETAEGTITKTTTTTFTPEVKTRVVKYFDTYKTEKFGLPPGLLAQVKIEKIPPAWRTTAIAPGLVIAEEQRDILIAAPPDLVKLLPPPPTAEVRYFVAGGNVIAVNKEFKVVDSIQIPSVKIVIDD